MFRLFPLGVVTSNLRRFSTPAVALISLSLATILVLNIFSRLDSDVILEALGLSGLLFVSLLFALGTRVKSLDNSKTVLTIAVMIWGFLLILEELFARAETSEVEQSFSLAVYGEISLWVVCALVIALVFLRNTDYWRRILIGRSKSLILFGIFCTLSAAYAPVPLFSAAWAFKLLLVIFALHLCCSVMLRDPGLLRFGKVTFWAFVLVMFIGALRDPSSLITDGRLGTSPTALAEVAGIVLILSLGLAAIIRTRWPFLLTFASAAILFLSGGKAGIGGSLLSVGIFFLLKRKVGSALLLLTALVGLGFVLVLGTSLHEYAESYTETEQADSLTGRTDLWVAAIPLIRQRPLFGHGYMASKYISLQVQDVPWEAGHLHNSFLDVLYNNGLAGLALILYMHVTIVRSLFSVIKRTRSSSVAYELSVTFLAIYVNLLVSSCFNSTIGGRPSYFFMLFMGIYMISGNLAQVSSNKSSPAVSLAAA